jgi:hypothetical protein
MSYSIKFLCLSKFIGLCKNLRRTYRFLTIRMDQLKIIQDTPLVARTRTRTRDTPSKPPMGTKRRCGPVGSTRKRLQLQDLTVDRVDNPLLQSVSLSPFVSDAPFSLFSIIKPLSHTENRSISKILQAHHVSYLIPLFREANVSFRELQDDPDAAIHRIQLKVLEKIRMATNGSP